MPGRIILENARSRARKSTPSAARTTKREAANVALGSLHVRERPWLEHKRSVPTRLNPYFHTNISRISTYLSKINVADTDRCECGMTETVIHFLFLCPRWRDERQAMRSAHGSRYWDVSYALGGYSTAERDGKEVDGEKDKWQPDLNAVKVTIEYAIKTGRQV